MTTQEIQFGNGASLIDAHTHQIPLRYLERVLEDPQRFSASARMLDEDVYELVPEFWSSARFASSYRLDPRYYDWPTRLAAMDTLGIRTAVVSANQSLNYAWSVPDVAVDVVQMVNDDLAEGMERFPGRIIGIASVPLQDGVLALEEAKRAIEELGLRGIQLLSSIEGTNLSKAGLDAVIAYAAGVGVPIFVHPYGALNHDRMTEHVLVNVIGFPAELGMAISGLIFDGILDDNPELMVLLGHGGGVFPYLLGRIERGMTAFPDLMRTARPLRDYLHQIYVDALVHDDDALNYLLGTVGSDRLVLGTDWPYWMQDPDIVDRVDRVMNAAGVPLSALSKNAERLFGRMGQ